MRVSLDWLGDYVDIDVSVDKLKELLDLSGTKVETITRPGRDVKGVVVATVREVEPHPDADSLSLVDVSVGDASHKIVCGATNFAVGDKVALATVGARLPGMEITERKIRGRTSAGMLCSSAELGISKDQSGLIILPQDSPEGEDVVAVLGLDDTILELEITPNRPDCMGLIGVAREVSAILHTELRVPQVASGHSSPSDLRVEIEATDGCTRYLGQKADVTGVHSPSWMARRLLAAGTRPISGVVDVTNYVMMETGQPLHAFDAAKIQKGIVVRRPRRGESITLLDGRSVALHADDLVIADASVPLALAGVMGGAASEVSDSTTQIVLESAHFDPRSISYTTRRHNIRTEGSARFERDVDPDAVPYAAARAMGLLAEIGAGSATQGPAEVIVGSPQKRIVNLRPGRTDAILGESIRPETQVEILNAIGVEAAMQDGTITATIPTFRPDLTREIDLVEEVGRLSGYDRIASSLPPGLSGGLTAQQTAERKLKMALATLGLHEVWTGALTSPAELDLLGLDEEHPARRFVALENPMLDEESVLRTTLMPSLLRTVARNVAHRQRSIAVFELARVYEPSRETLPHEAQVLAIACCGDVRPKSWLEEARPWDLFALKSVVEAALGSLGVGPVTLRPVSGMPFHPTRAASISVSGSDAGITGELHPDVCERFDVPEGTVVLEIAIAPIMSHLPEEATASEPPRFPAAFMDLAVVVDEATPAASVQELIRAAGAPEVVSVRLFDIYRGDQIPAGRKSLAYALEMRSDEGTLGEEQTTRVRERIVAALAERLRAELRG